MLNDHSRIQIQVYFYHLDEKLSRRQSRVDDRLEKKKAWSIGQYSLPWSAKRPFKKTVRKNSISHSIFVLTLTQRKKEINNNENINNRN